MQFEAEITLGPNELPEMAADRDWCHRRTPNRNDPTWLFNIVLCARSNASIPEIIIATFQCTSIYGIFRFFSWEGCISL